MKNKTFLDSVRCAVAGIGKGIRTEKNFAYYAVIAVVAFLLNFLCKADGMEFVILILLVAIVFSLEFINTAIERISDAVKPEYNKSIGDIKDISAAAVLVSGIAFFVIEALILIPKL